MLFLLEQSDFVYDQNLGLCCISVLQAVSTEKLSIAESLKATAEAVVLEQSGFVYDQNSGLYYDYNSGYYYDNVSVAHL